MSQRCGLGCSKLGVNSSADEEVQKKWNMYKQIVQRMNIVYDGVKAYFAKIIEKDGDNFQKMERFKNIGRELVKASVELS